MVERKPSKSEPEAKVAGDEVRLVHPGDGNLYVEFRGKRIARRGSGKRWVSLDPEYTVRGGEAGNLDELVIEYVPASGPH